MEKEKQNQCDGCQSKLEIKDGDHYKNGRIVIGCTKDRYVGKEECSVHGDGKFPMDCNCAHPEAPEWEKEFDDLWSDRADPTPNRKDRIKRFIFRLRNQTLESAAKAIEEKYSGEIATDGVTKIIREMKTK